MTTQNKISIVISVEKYNKKILENCVNSLFNQTTKNIEIFLLNLEKNDKLKNDFSLLKQTHDNIFLIETKDNSFVGSKLETISQLSGNKVVFLSQDEYVCRDFLRKLDFMSNENEADVVVCDWVWQNSKKNTRSYIPFEEFRNIEYSLTNKEIIEKFVSGHGYNFSWEILANKMFDINLLKSAMADLQKLSEISNNSEMAFRFILYLHAKKLINCHDIHCFIPQGKKTKIVENYDEKLLQDKKGEFELLNNLIAENNLTETLSKDFEIWKNKIISNLQKEFSSQKNVFKKYFGSKTYQTNCVELTDFTVDFGNEYDNYEKIIEAITSDKTKIVSFDIFDTLITRNCLDPKDIFIILGNEFSKELSNAFFVDFRTLRESAEMNVRHRYSHGEIDIYEIYDYMVEEYGFDKTLAQKLLEREIELEYELSVPRLTGKDLYNIALLNGKKVIFTSDMYLPKTLIKRLLEKSGYASNFDIFLSYEQKASKHTGKLYDIVLKTCHVQKDEIIHIGDNEYSDIEVAKKHGIKSFCLENPSKLYHERLLFPLTNNNVTISDPNRQFIYVGLRLIAGTISRKLFDFPFTHPVSSYQCSPRYIGYYALGMHLYSLTDWICSLSKNSYDTIHFVARDGYLPLKAYEIFQKYYNHLPNSNYIYLSRKFLFPLSITEKKDWFSCSKQLTLEAQSVNKVLSYFPENCIKHDEVEKLSKKFRETKCTNPDDFYKLIPLFDKCIDYDNLKKYNKICKDKFLKVVKKNDILFGIGYSQREGAILSGALGYPVDSFHLHSFTDSSLLNECKHNSKTHLYYDYCPFVVFDIREIVFMGTGNSVKGYDIEKDTLIFSDKNEHTEETRMIVDLLQKNALMFVEDLLKQHIKHSDLLSCGKEELSLPWEVYLANSNNLDRQLFAGFMFEDDIAYGTHSLLELWDYLSSKVTHKNSANHLCAKKKQSFIIKVANKLLPPGTKRRANAKKFANWLCPPNSKRRKFAKKLIGR